MYVLSKILLLSKDNFSIKKIPVKNYVLVPLRAYSKKVSDSNDFMTFNIIY